MSRYFAILSAVILLGAGCIPQDMQKGGQVTPVVADQPTEIPTDVFEKKSECAKLLDGVRARIEKENRENKDQRYPSGLVESSFLRLDRICYSQRRNSCISFTNETTYANDVTGIAVEGRIWIDELTGEKTNTYTYFSAKDDEGTRNKKWSEYNSSVFSYEESLDCIR